MKENYCVDYIYAVFLFGEDRHERAVLCRTGTLPFVPYPGLKVHFPEDDEQGYDFSINKVIWHQSEERFTALIDPDRMICAPDYEKHVADVSSRGWARNAEYEARPL